MTTTDARRIDFTPGRDILGKTTERNMTGRFHQAGLKGLYNLLRERR